MQELCEIARDTPPAQLTLPSGDVLLSRDATSRFLGALPLRCPQSMHAESPMEREQCARDGPGLQRRGVMKTNSSVGLTKHGICHYSLKGAGNDSAANPRGKNNRVYRGGLSHRQVGFPTPSSRDADVPPVMQGPSASFCGGQASCGASRRWHWHTPSPMPLQRCQTMWRRVVMRICACACSCNVAACTLACICVLSYVQHQHPIGALPAPKHAVRGVRATYNEAV